MGVTLFFAYPVLCLPFLETILPFKGIAWHTTLFLTDSIKLKISQISFLSFVDFRNKICSDTKLWRSIPPWAGYLREYRWKKLPRFPFWGLDICVDFNLRNQRTKKEWEKTTFYILILCLSGCFLSTWKVYGCLELHTFVHKKFRNSFNFRNQRIDMIKSANFFSYWYCHNKRLK